MADERFKPIRIKDADSDVKRAAERASEDWTAPVFQPMYNKWWEYLRWFEGDQYGYIRGKKDANWFDVTRELDREVKNVYNRILPMIRQQHGDLIFDSEFYTIAATQEAADRKSAAVASVIIEQSNYDRGFNKKQMEAKLLILLLGNCYWKEWWNKNLWALAYDEKKGATRVKGDVDYQKVAAQVFLADQCREVMKSLGYKAPEKNSVTHAFLIGKQKSFDPAKPAEYLAGFAIKRA